MAESKKNTEASKAQINLGSWISRGWDMISADLGSFILLGLIYVAIIGIASSTVIGEFLVIGPLQVGLFIVIFSKMRGNPVNPDLSTLVILPKVSIFSSPLYCPISLLAFSALLVFYYASSRASLSWRYIFSPRHL